MCKCDSDEIMNICTKYLLISFFSHCLTEKFNIIDRVTGNGYPVEYHEIETEDGYILGTYRIPFGRRSKTRHINKYPVLLMHGLLSTSESYLLLGPDKSLGYILADKGYDVWLCNARGSYYSRKHKILNPDVDKEFWKFSWHEIGAYDLPATIDYVLNVTNNKKVQYVGHSQGATAFFVMGAERPEYNHKIEVSIMLSPPVFVTRAPNEIFQALVPFVPVIEKIADALQIYEVFPPALTEIMQQIDDLICRSQSKFTTVCDELLTFATGSYEDQIDSSTHSLMSLFHPGGSSIKQIVHYSQLIKSGRFQKYDWGPSENIRRYGSEKPPEYNLKNVVAPVAIFYAEKDIYSQTVGVLRLAKILPNLVELYKVPYENWSHVDFIWARDVNKYLNPKVVEVMKKYNDT